MSSVRMNAGRVVDLDLWQDSQLFVSFFSQISDIATLFLRPYPPGRVITDQGKQFQKVLTGVDSGASVDLRNLPLNQPSFSSVVSAWPVSVRTIVNGFQIPSGSAVSATPNIVGHIPPSTNPQLVIQSISTTGPGPQVSTGVIVTGDAATTYSVTIGAHSESVTALAGESDIADDLAAACNASSDSGFSAITWSSPANSIRGTADANGVAFSASLSVSGGTGTVSDLTRTPEPPIFLTNNDFTPLGTWINGELVNLSNPTT